MKFLKPNQDRKILLNFKFSKSPSVMIQAKRPVADMLKEQGCKIKHPLTGKEIMLKFYGMRPDFRRCAMVWDFVEVEP